MLQRGTRVAERYEIEAVLGRGGTGAVYRALDTATGETVALKTLHEHFYDRDDLVNRFEREARAAASVRHPSIVGMRATGTDRALGVRFIVQDFLRGADVAGCLNELGCVSPLSALAIALPVMDALVAAHAAGIVHRDVKPENMFLHETDDGCVVPKLIDFGIAKVFDELDQSARTATGMVFGTPWYMSPEQALGDSAIDARTDVWSMGATVYEMVCGTLPFGANNPNAVMAQIIYGSPVPLRQRWPGAPADLEAVLHKALQRDLGQRYATMAEFRDALAACDLWRGVTPEIAQSLRPRPSAFEGILDILPMEFRDEPGAVAHRTEPAPRARRTPEPCRPVAVDRQSPGLLGLGSALARMGALLGFERFRPGQGAANPGP
jgi:serine/threonine protein kinase